MNKITFNSNSRIKCSRKTLHELGIDKEPIGYGNFKVDPFYCCYAHLFLLERRK